MKKYHLTNNIIGWIIGIIACTVYIMTAEPTASWWDCGEYIATANKLQVGHPPGAPTFQLIGRLFSMFSSPENVAFAVNVMSAICSGLSIMFLFWTITLLGKKITGLKPEELSLKDGKVWAVFASGIVGSLAYCFSDTFWFSAVEGEVYAMSSFFTAVVFWAILKWEEQADQPHSLRWLIFIVFLIGVAIGVHLLNLLAIPAIVYVYYFKKWDRTTVKGFILAGIISVALLAVILFFIIPYVVNIAGWFEVAFVNGIGLPFNSGTIFFFVLLAALIVFGLWWSVKKAKPVLNAVILAFLFLLIGYSTFFVLVIRANSNTPLNENAPKDAVALRAYLGREQYGSTPLFSGQYFTAVPIGIDEGYTKYIRGEKEYVPVAKAVEYEYDKENCGFFPRMYSNDEGRQHPLYYRYWSETPGNRKPNFVENMRYFFRYQCNFMYWRYFMWNFVGRQNDIQGHYFNSDGSRDYINGNWISGISFLDEIRLGPQKNLPDHLANNKARNTYYFLPLLLGICGLIYHFRKNRKDTFIVFLLFFMTGLAIVVYLNQPPQQPRERDYAYAASFYAFAIWIGLGVMAISDWLSKLLKNSKVAVAVTFLVTLFCVPVLMANQNWDDHDRSKKYAAKDFADNYLKNLKPNSVIISFGDNDTFPLWYTQEVEGTRSDVRILNYTLAGMYWYVEQLFNKIYDSDALPFTLSKDFYRMGHDNAILRANGAEYIEVSELFRVMNENKDRFYQVSQMGDEILVIPTKRFKITLDKPALVAQGVITQEVADVIPNEICWEIKKDQLYRHELMMLDILGTNKFMRNIYLMNPSYIKSVFPMASEYTIQDGLVHRLLPHPNFISKTDIDATYNYYVKGTGDGELKWGNMADPSVYVDPVSLNMGVVQRQTWVLFAQELIEKGEVEKAKKILALGDKYFPKENFPHDRFCTFFIDVYNKIGDHDKAIEYFDDIYEYYMQDFKYYTQFKGKKASGVRGELEGSVQMLYVLSDIARKDFHDEETADKILKVIRPYLY